MLNNALFRVEEVQDKEEEERKKKNKLSLAGHKPCLSELRLA